MERAIISLVILIAFLAVSFGLRAWLHWRATGHSGFVGVSGRIGSLAWSGGVLFVIGLVLAVASPVWELAAPTPWGARPTWLDAAALAAAALGVAGTVWAQAVMGRSWRIGVRQSDRTELVMRGPFVWVRNPIFSFMLLAAAGLAAFMPNPTSLASFVCLLAAVELQVRWVEEPYLRGVHAEAYDVYCRRVGRFVPWMGRVASRR